MPRLGTLIDAKDPVQAALETLDCVIELLRLIKSLK